MQIPTVDLASDKLLLLGAFHIAALEQTAETKGLKAGMEAAQKALAAAQTGREAGELALVAPRVAVRFSEHALEGVLRDLAGDAHGMDNNNAGGPAFDALFPNGLEGAIRPRGAAQVEAARKVVNQLSVQPAVASLRAARQKALEAATADLDAKLAARKKAGDGLALARATEDGARETFVASYDSNAGGIRSLFPRNRRKQDLYFDEFRTRNVADADEDDGGTGAGGSGPAVGGGPTS